MKKFSTVILYVSIILIIACVVEVLISKKPYKKMEKDDYYHITSIGHMFFEYPYDAKTIKCDEKSEKIPSLSEIKSLDCMTYIDTVLSLYQSENNDKKGQENFTKNLQKIRYKNGKNTCQNRNHFFIADWIKNNPFFSFTDVTENIFPNAKFDEKNIAINRNAWFKKNHNLNTNFAIENMTIKYIPFAEVLKYNKRDLISKLDPASIIAIVNKKIPEDVEKYGTYGGVSHVGFLINTGKWLWIRHASYTHKQVLDEDFFEYINSLKNSPHLAGIIILKIENKK